MKFKHFFIAINLLLFGLGVAAATPFTPSSPDQVLETLRLNLNDREGQQLRQLRGQLAQNPKDLRLASGLAKRYLERGQVAADPRYSGYAQAALAPWYNLAKPPAPVLVLRATIRQRQHDFAAALTDTEAALALDPRDPQAWVTHAVLKMVMGDPASAKRSCLPLFRTASELAAVTCVAAAASQNGQAAKASVTLRQVLAQHPQASLGERHWALDTLAESAWRAGDLALAEQSWQQALALDDGDSYSLSSYADFLIQQGRASEALRLIRQRATGQNGGGSALPRSDALLLRLALAAKASRDPILAPAQAALAARSNANARRGDTSHRREQAILSLHILGQPQQALALAQANWKSQKESLDALILLQSALATSNKAAAQPVLAWLKTTGLEDQQIKPLVKQLGGLQ
jgi:Tfp pilus assembly protein PilF